MTERAPKSKQYPAAKRQWEARTGQSTVGARLGPDYLARFERLAARYGGARQAIEAGIEALERADDGG